MQILIIGSGATGGFLGSRLIERGADVTFLVRPERKRQLITRGLTVFSPFGRFRRPVHAIVPEEIKGTYSLVIPAVRAQDYERALELAASAIGPDAVLMPVIEGIAHLLPPASSPRPRLIGAVFEGRVTHDADGILSHRPPPAELSIGALNKKDAAVASHLSKLITGRGMKTVLSERIRAKTWERFTYMAAGIALCARAEQPLRQVVRGSHFIGPFDKLLNAGTRIGEAAGFEPSAGLVLGYRNAFMREGRPILPPPTIAAGGRAGDEAGYLLAEMIGMGRRFGANEPEFLGVWRKVTAPIKRAAVASDDAA